MLLACAVDVVHDNLDSIVLAQVVHRNDELVVAGVIARGVLVFLDVGLAAGIHLRDDVASLLLADVLTVHDTLDAVLHRGLNKDIQVVGPQAGITGSVLLIIFLR